MRGTIKLEGVYPPIATPFDERGRLDAQALAANICRWNETSLSGYVVAGSNGEGALLEFDEVLAALRLAREAATPDKRVIAGTGCQSTAGTIRLTCAAADVGADAVLVLPPFFYGEQMTETALLKHYEAVANASPLPVILYNMPKFTHLNLAPETVARLAGHGNIVGIKDSAGNIGQLIELRRLCPRDFQILVGNAAAFLSGIQMGATGGILALANVAPRECVAIWQLAKQGRFEEAREIHFRLMPVARAVTTQFGVPGLKAALDLLGYEGGSPRLPLLPVSEAAREEIRQILITAGLLA
jgi:4-hydroxy-2-oxoglutarate aldolase